MYYVYILRCDDQSLYTGITTDVKRRYHEHLTKHPQAAAYTKSRNVIGLEAVWQAEDRSSASKLEYQIKQLPKREKENLIGNPQILKSYKSIDIKTIKVPE
ncbi:MAG TPA: GIY-YIG nuclease family protein [Erysipelothrix sp.]